MNLKRHKRAKIIATTYAHCLLGEIKWRPISGDSKFIDNFKFFSTMLQFERNGQNFQDQDIFRNALNNNSEDPDEFPKLFDVHKTIEDDRRFKKRHIFY